MENSKLETLLEVATSDWQSLDDGEKAIAKAYFNAKEKGLDGVVLGLGLQVTWEREVPLIVGAMRKFSIEKIYFASRQTDSVKFLGLFTEIGATIGGFKKFEVETGYSELFETIWAAEIYIEV